MEEEKQDNQNMTESEVQETIVDTLKKQADDYLKGWQIERANLLNYQRDENERISKILILNERKIILEILSIIDNFELLIKNLQDTNEYTEGIKLVYNQLILFLKNHNCIGYESINQIFDPNLHEAMEILTDENQTNNLIVEEVQKGYKLNDIVLRPAKVKVIINSK